MNSTLFEYLFDEIADKRVKNWTLMVDPVPLFFIIVSYLIIVLKVGPSLMKNRPPFKLKTVLAIYNLVMVIFCVKALVSYYQCGFTLMSLVRCIDVDYSNDPVALRILEIMYWTHIIKLVELVETVFFVMRKKQNQVSFLHVYHHASTLFLTWIGVKYVGGGMVIFSYILNFSVHVVMYSYYFLSVFGTRVQNMTKSVKKMITMIQMVQFVLMLIQCILSVIHNCAIPFAVLCMYFPNISLNLFLFFKFYNRSYKANGKDK